MLAEAWVDMMMVVLELVMLMVICLGDRESWHVLNDIHFLRAGCDVEQSLHREYCISQPSEPVGLCLYRVHTTLLYYQV